MPSRITLGALSLLLMRFRDGADTSPSSDHTCCEDGDRPHNSHPISVQWGEQAQTRFNDRQFVTFGTVEIPVYQVDLDVDSIEDDGSINISISTEGFCSVYRLMISVAITGGYRHEYVSGPPLLFRKFSAPAMLIAEYLESAPFIV